MRRPRRSASFRISHDCVPKQPAAAVRMTRRNGDPRPEARRAPQSHERDLLYNGPYAVRSLSGWVQAFGCLRTEPKRRGTLAAVRGRYVHRPGWHLAIVYDGETLHASGCVSRGFRRGSALGKERSG